MKTCCDCKKTKHKTEFYRNRKVKDGYMTRCKDCDKEYKAANRLLYNKRKYEWKERNREKAIAHKELNLAIKQNIIGRPKVCEICGVRHSMIEGHHWDYCKPLNVIWMCKPCHTIKHYRT